MAAVTPAPIWDAALQRSFDEWLEQAFRDQLVRDPELLSELGLAQAFGMDNSQLTNVSDAYQRETYALLQSQLDTLHSYDRAALSPERQLSYDLFEWSLDDQLRGERYRFYAYPVNQLFGMQNTFIEFMTDRHPLATLQDAQDYVSRLAAFATKTDQTLEWLEIQEKNGITPPQLMVQRVLDQLRWYVSQSPRNTELYQAFEAKVAELGEISDEAKAALYQDAANAIQSSAIPAYRER